MAINKGKKGAMWCSDFCVDGDRVWFINGELNAVIEYSMTKRETRFVCKAPDTKMVQEYLFIRILKYKKYIILVPYFADSLFIFDLEKNKFIYTKYMKEMYKTVAVFSDACIEGGVLYCTPYSIGNPIFVFDLVQMVEKNEIQINNISLGGSVINHCCLYGNSIYAVVINSGYIIKCDIDKRKVDFIQIDGVNGIGGIANFASRICLQSINEKTLIVWNPLTNQIESKLVLPKVSGAICAIDDKKVWVDTNDGFSNVVNMETGDIEIYDKLNKQNPLLRPEYSMGPAYRIKDVFYSYNRFKSSLIVYQGDKWDEIVIRTTFEDAYQYICEVINSGYVVNENRIIDLGDLIKCI